MAGRQRGRMTAPVGTQEGAFVLVEISLSETPIARARGDCRGRSTRSSPPDRSRGWTRARFPAGASRAGGCARWEGNPRARPFQEGSCVALGNPLLLPCGAWGVAQAGRTRRGRTMPGRPAFPREPTALTRLESPEPDPERAQPPKRHPPPRLQGRPTGAPPVGSGFKVAKAVRPPASQAMSSREHDRPAQASCSPKRRAPAAGSGFRRPRRGRGARPGCTGSAQPRAAGRAPPPSRR